MQHDCVAINVIDTCIHQEHACYGGAEDGVKATAEMAGETFSQWRALGWIIGRATGNGVHQSGMRDSRGHACERLHRA